MCNLALIRRTNTFVIIQSGRSRAKIEPNISFPIIACLCNNGCVRSVYEISISTFNRMT